jgi:hypothetical protein
MAVCLLKIGGADNVAEASKLLEKVPELHQKIARKSTPVEVRTATHLLTKSHYLTGLGASPEIHSS